MISISPEYISKSGGLLPALLFKSADYVQSLLPKSDIKFMTHQSTGVERIITHFAPHIDEYFAMLLFRACEEATRRLPLQEEVLYLARNDSRAKQLWPTSVLFGLGGGHSGGATPKLLFDEHRLEGQPRTYSSCSHMVSCIMLKEGPASLPPSVSQAFVEVDHIDANGNAHPLNLNNLIKSLHETEFIFSRGNSSLDDIKDTLPNNWKESIIAATITAVIFANENSKYINDDAVLKQAVEESLEHYRKCSMLRDEVRFAEAYQTIRNNVLNFNVLFRDAVLKRADGKGNVVPIRRNSVLVPQVMLLPKLVLACRECWGPEVGQIIMYHFWEAEVFKQLSYIKMFSTLQTTIKDDQEDLNVATQVGRLQFRKFDKIVEEVVHTNTKTKQTSKVKRPLWVISLAAAPDTVTPNRATLSFINKANTGFGIFMVQNVQQNTRAIFKGAQFPYSRWKRIVDRIMEREGNTDNKKLPGCWHITKNENGQYAGFLLNGNKAHQYVPRSAIDIDTLAEVIRTDYIKFPLIQ